MKEGIFNLFYYNYRLPPRLIAQEPVLPQDSCRLLVILRRKDTFKEVLFKDIINFLNKGDVLVLNDTKVINARLIGKRRESRVEVLILREKGRGIGEVLIKPGKRARVNDTIVFEGGNFTAKVLAKTPAGGRILQFSPPQIRELLAQSGKVPLPPYVKREINDPRLYQTVYAKREGAVASPTAGLHFTPSLLEKIRDKGIEVVFITLHCSLATFRPVKEEDIRKHIMDTEWVEISPPAADKINQAKKEKRRIIISGTTSLRAVESAASYERRDSCYLKPFCGETNLYILPGYHFKITNALITNFHTPCSTNLILASSFCGRKLLERCYAYAIRKNFRFYTFGDAMFIL